MKQTDVHYCTIRGITVAMKLDGDRLGGLLVISPRDGMVSYRWQGALPVFPSVQEIFRNGGVPICASSPQDL